MMLSEVQPAGSTNSVNFPAVIWCKFDGIAIAFFGSAFAALILSLCSGVSGSVQGLTGSVGGVCIGLVLDGVAVAAGTTGATEWMGGGWVYGVLSDLHESTGLWAVGVLQLKLGLALAVDCGF